MICYQEDDIDLVKFLLRCGANPNELVVQQSSWVRDYYHLVPMLSLLCACGIFRGGGSTAGSDKRESSPVRRAVWNVLKQVHLNADP